MLKSWDDVSHLPEEGAGLPGQPGGLGLGRADKHREQMPGGRVLELRGRGSVHLTPALLSSAGEPNATFLKCSVPAVPWALLTLTQQTDRRLLP